MAGKNEADLSSKPVGKLLISLAVPTITAQIVNMLYNIVDRIYIGQGVGKTALTGVGVSFPILILISAFSSLIGMGGAPRASIRMGQKDRGGAEQILGNCFVTLLSISLVLTVFFRAFSGQLLMMFGASPDTRLMGWLISTSTFLALSLCSFHWGSMPLLPLRASAATVW